jgi:hypothetical protein
MADRKNQRHLQTVQGSDRTIEVYEASQVADVAADGFLRTWTGAQVSKIELFRLLEVIDAAGGKPAVEHREMFMRLTVPTPALIEFCFNIITGVGTNLPKIEEGAQSLRKLVTDAVARASSLKV